MVESVENLVLEQLRAIRGSLADLAAGQSEIKARLNSLEIGQAALRRDVAALSGDIALQHGQYDRLSDRIERIEKRLELRDA